MSYVTYLIILISLNEHYQHIGKVFSICKKKTISFVERNRDDCVLSIMCISRNGLT